MKKVLFSLASVLLLLSSCGSDENITEISKTGNLVTKVSFEAVTTKASSSTAIPITGWNNVNKIQLFLYNASDGTVAFSDVIDPKISSDKTFRWTNVPEGTYELAIVANIKSDDDSISTSLDHGANWKKFDAYNVLNRKLNSQLFIDLKKSKFPATHNFGAAEAYASASEIFTAYTSTVTIKEGQTTNLAGTETLKLKREVSLMRIRIDKTDKLESAPVLSTIDFANSANFIAIENMPVGIGLKLGTFAGGIYDTASDAKRIMIGARGLNTYNSADPALTSYNPNTILGSGFTLWQDIRVLPNATRADNKKPSDDADPARRYVIVLAAWAPTGYEYADGKIAEKPQPVYWSGTIKGVFSPNAIREVNMNIKSKGYPEIPNPQKEGELEITIGASEDWNATIESESVEV